MKTVRDNPYAVGYGRWMIRILTSLVESIKRFRKIIGEPTLGDDFISDVSKKSTFARSTKDFLAESMCVTIKHLVRILLGRIVSSIYMRNGGVR